MATRFKRTLGSLCAVSGSLISSEKSWVYNRNTKSVKTVMIARKVGFTSNPD